MKFIKYFLVGILFGIIMTKSEAISWFRIQEMFRFESFHMYGIIGTAVVLGVIIHQVMQRTGFLSISGEEPKWKIPGSAKYRYIIGGTIFGLGWAMTGACPGPMFTLLGHGIWSMLLVIASAIIGAFAYGTISSKLPH
ncbi:MAG: YeeE/YedE family protein [Bacteroidia bacterium]|nr:YeeE/YedE family protein [Bacteroidia bacterium]